MPPVADLLVTLHYVLLGAFVGVTALLMLVTVMNRYRIKGLLLSWRNPEGVHVPVWPTLFIGAVLAALSYSLAVDQALHPLFFAGYVVGGAFWFGATLLSKSMLVTECGLIDNVNRAHKGVAWGQIVDYFTSDDASNPTYVFFYLDDEGTRRRFEMAVPALHADAFEDVLAEKLDERFDMSVCKSYGKTALEE